MASLNTQTPIVQNCFKTKMFRIVKRGSSNDMKHVNGPNACRATVTTSY